MNNEQNKLIEMAREFLAKQPANPCMTAEDDVLLLSSFAQHVLDKQWTRVEDELPEKSDIFDITVDYGFHDPHTDIADFINGIWYDLDGNEYTMPNVLAWRERPQPYMQPEKEGK